MNEAKARACLGVDASAEASEVRKAYLKKALVTHPDKENGSAEAFREVQEAYEFLRKKVEKSAPKKQETPEPAREPAKEKEEEKKNKESPAEEKERSRPRPPPRTSSAKPFRCADCGRKFKTAQYLRVHSATHRRPKSAKRTKSARRQKRESNEQFWICGFCGKTKLPTSATECDLCNAPRGFVEDQGATDLPPQENDSSDTTKSDRAARARERERRRQTAAAAKSSASVSTMSNQEREDAELAEALQRSLFDDQKKSHIPQREKEERMIAEAVKRSHEDELERALHQSRNQYTETTIDFDPKAHSAAANHELWSRQILLLRDLGFAPTVAAAYADCRLPIQAVLDNMFEDRVDLSEEPVWQARAAFDSALSGIANQAASAIDSLLTGFRSMTTTSTENQPTDTQKAEHHGWVKYDDHLTRQPYYYHPVLELSSWTDPINDPNAVLYDVRATSSVS